MTKVIYSKNYIDSTKTLNYLFKNGYKFSYNASPNGVVIRP